MTEDEKALNARSMIAAQLQELGEVVRRARSDGDFDSAYERLRRWKERTVRLLDQHVSAIEADRLLRQEKGSFIMGEPLRNLADEADMYRRFLLALDEQLGTHPEDILDIPAVTHATPPEVHAPAPQESRAVFIIHGHDELNLLRLKEDQPNGRNRTRRRSRNGP